MVSCVRLLSYIARNVAWIGWLHLKPLVMVVGLFFSDLF